MGWPWPGTPFAQIEDPSLLNCAALMGVTHMEPAETVSIEVKRRGIHDTEPLASRGRYSAASNTFGVKVCLWDT